ncbi:MAG: hypothetical protein VKP63_01210 [Cyanobacteriota bacterium]|nr:hypothetical protein [Cyanobacteriota bacterium]
MTPAPSSPSARSAATPHAAAEARPTSPATEAAPPDPVLCAHCGRTARNGLTCQGICVADSGY